MNKDSTEDFDILLSWLDPDRESAGEKYETIRQQLIKIFTWNRVSDPEGLADEAITRVTRRVADIMENYAGDPRLYFYGVAKKLLLEERRLSKRRPELELDEMAAEIIRDEGREQLYNCLDKCMSKLSAPNRDLLLRYYEGSKQSKVNTSRALASQLGLQPSALRMRMLRIRTRLEKCIENCKKVTSA